MCTSWMVENPLVIRLGKLNDGMGGLALPGQMLIGGQGPSRPVKASQGPSPPVGSASGWPPTFSFSHRQGRIRESRCVHPSLWALDQGTASQHPTACSGWWTEGLGTHGEGAIALSGDHSETAGSTILGESCLILQSGPALLVR